MVSVVQAAEPAAEAASVEEATAEEPAATQGESANARRRKRGGELMPSSCAC